MLSHDYCIPPSTAFLSANLEKVPNGGWFTLAVSFGVALIKFIWLSGQLAKAAALEQAQKKINLNDVLSVVDTQPGDDDLVSVSYHRHLTSESQPLSSNQMSAFASAVSEICWGAPRHHSLPLICHYLLTAGSPKTGPVLRVFRLCILEQTRVFALDRGFFMASPSHLLS